MFTLNDDEDRVLDDEFAAKVLSALAKAPAQLPAVEVDEHKTRNAATCMTTFLCARLAQSGPEPQPIDRTTFRWNSGLLNLRNSVKDHLWTNLRPTFVEHLRALKEGADAAYVMTAWQPPETKIHVWVIPEEVVYDALPNHAVGQITDKRTIRILPTTQQFERCTNSPDLTPYYQQLEWSAAELTKLAEAVKIDVAVTCPRVVNHSIS